ncbi:hypothetical protein SAMN04488028_101301 [Reichenbachiella agariperforans]|uniref:Uncharacterized protein n=1 Tax=Reichenbachiella agariperforans TaxID=156994 RepID=A0A1M6JSA6_REIAG|nr:hypothetical protein SAMN04488028_101301 [Reichenbachiella agariperforans]
MPMKTIEEHTTVVYITCYDGFFFTKKLTQEQVNIPPRNN